MASTRLDRLPWPQQTQVGVRVALLQSSSTGPSHERWERPLALCGATSRWSEHTRGAGRGGVGF